MDSKMLVYQSLILLMCDITKSTCTIAILTKKNSSYNMASHKACLEWKWWQSWSDSEN